MPGQVPLRNAQFIESPDFNNQAIQGITGSGVFRQFSYVSPGGTSTTLNSSNLWNIIELTGNGIVTVPGGITANVGDEIMVVNSTGTISFSATAGATILSNTYYVIPARRPARLVYAGSNNWILAGDKAFYSNFSVTDCCDNSQPTLYTFNNADLTEFPTAYANRFGTSLYTSSAVGGVVQVSSNAYTIVSGSVNASACETVGFGSGYQFFNAYGSTISGLFYSYESGLDITVNDQIAAYPFKYNIVNDVYRCNTDSAVNGTYYRSSDMYGGTRPVCFVNGFVTSFAACPT